MAAGDLLLLSSALLFGVRPEQPRLGRRATQTPLRLSVVHKFVRRIADERC